MKKFLILILSSIMLVLTSINISKANMPVGGELIYVHLGDSTYQVFFKLYQNCAATTTPDSIDLCVKNTCTKITLSRKMGMTQIGPNGTVINPFCPNTTTSCTNASSSYIAYRIYFYSDTVTLPSRCNNWVFSVNAGKRLPVNNVSGTPQDMYIEATLNNTISHTNNSPYYSVWPAYVAEAGIPFHQKVGVLEADGDSLHTHLLNPLTSTAICGDTVKPVPFMSGANPPYHRVTNPFQTNNTFSQNVHTADFGFATASMQGHSTLVFRTDEYRNGVLIGSVMREMLVQVVPPGPAKQTSIKLTCDTPRNSGSINDTIYACVGQKVEMCYAVTSLPGSRLFVADDVLINTSLPGAIITYKNQGTDSVHVMLSWTPGSVHAGKDLTLTHTITDSTCTPTVVVRSSTKLFNFHVWGATSAGNDTTICLGNSATLKATGGGNYRWTVLPGGTANSLNDTTIPNPVASPFISTTYAVRSTKNEYCQYKTKDTVTVNVNSDITPTVINITASPGSNVWQWLNVTFTANSTGCSDPVYQWKVNNVYIPGATGQTWSSTTLNNNDIVTCHITCNDTCASPRDTFSNAITMNVATSLTNINYEHAKVYPNPNNGTFTIALNDFTAEQFVKAEIINTLGQSVQNFNINEPEQTITVNAPAGLYLLKLQYPGKTSFLKIHIQ